MSHSDEHHEQLTVAEFFEEYWILLFFGLLFMLTVFLPLLFMDDRNWLYWGVVITIVVAMGLLVIPALSSRNKSK